ncbi:MAG: FAD-dependent oxidoreductase [Spirochaetales bacterium]|jgi:fumarate reductase flavoprotein subunit|nr:FAD-dependent oxidoreductase [Spirochaetales bacterium]
MKNSLKILGWALVLACSACASGGNRTFNQEADLVIIGAGPAGLAAAVEAADRGVKRILILEKMPYLGGTAFVSHGLLAGYETQITKALGIHDTEEALYALLNENAEYRLDPMMARITVRQSGPTIDWLIDRIKVPFLPATRRGYGSPTMMHTIEGGGQGLREPFIRVLEEGGIPVLFETRATKLIRSAEDRIIGVEAVSGGKTLAIGAKAVVVATGGYSANNRLAEVLDPFYRDVLQTGLSSSTGDGLIMASAAGAGVSSTRLLSLDFKDYEIITAHNGSSDAANCNPIMSAPGVIYLNPQGLRFMNEKNLGFMFQRLGEPFFREMHRTNSPFLWAVVDQETFTAVSAKRGLNLEYLNAAGPGELASLMGITPQVLEDTLAVYNLAAAAGRDEEFNRPAATLKPLSGRLYAVKFAPVLGITYGGLLKNEKAQVLRLDETPIEGLYCAGEVSASTAWMGWTLSSCFSWGRIAGASAAEFIRGGA